MYDDVTRSNLYVPALTVYQLITKDTIMTLRRNTCRKCLQIINTFINLYTTASNIP